MSFFVGNSIMDFNDWKCLSSVTSDISELQFFSAINIWITRAHILDKRIFGTEVYSLGNYDDFALVKKTVENVPKSESSSVEALIEFLESQSLKQDSLIELAGNENRLRYSVQVQIIRFRKDTSISFSNLQLILVDFKDCTVTFHKLREDYTNLNYAVKLDQPNIKILFEESTNQDQKVLDWLSCSLLHSIHKWASGKNSSSIPALSLVSVLKYKDTYDVLKLKYATSIKKVWSEVTDADKFIHEDLAIAAYLIVLWKDQKQTYIDLGCGNGLLVHILNQEGHKGVGYDVRARKIWRQYPPTTLLEVQSIDPSANLRFPEADWIIGNHSDELTPWIPVIAMRSSYNTNFFILPCCPYDFNGQKFKRMNISKSQYADYLDYIQEVCVTCGFFIKRDRMRIPSTRRTCFVSFKRTYEACDFSLVQDRVMKLIQNCSALNVKVLQEEPSHHIKLRQPIEAVKNCTQLNQIIKKRMVSQLASIISSEHPTEAEWDEGNPTALKLLIQRMSPELVKHLKKECKGLQTFIKNHHHIFKIVDGEVSFRKPHVRHVEKKNWKKSQCWFFINHPQGCPLEDNECSYQHLQSSMDQAC